MAQVIVGVDPGTRIAGYAFLRAKVLAPRNPRDFEVLDAGVLRADVDMPSTQRIALLHEALYGLMAQHQPKACILEKAFFGENASSALKLGEARGAFIAAAGRVGADVHELTPGEVKKMITGNGRAEKEAVALALKALTGFDRGRLPHDVTDALALALTFGLSLSARFTVRPTQENPLR